MSQDAETAHRSPASPTHSPVPASPFGSPLPLSLEWVERLFAIAGVPSVVCGPGDIEQAHKPNEYVELAQLDACENFLRKFIRSMSVDVPQ